MVSLASWDRHLNYYTIKKKVMGYDNNDNYLTLIEQLLCTRHCSKSFPRTFICISCIFSLKYFPHRPLHSLKMLRCMYISLSCPKSKRERKENTIFPDFIFFSRYHLISLYKLTRLHQVLCFF